MSIFNGKFKVSRKSKMADSSHRCSKNKRLIDTWLVAMKLFIMHEKDN